MHTRKNYTDAAAAFFGGAWQTDSWKRSNSDNRQVIRVLFNEKGRLQCSRPFAK